MGVTYLNLVERGVQFHDLACDGETGLRAGLKEAELAIPLRLDLFHILQETHRLTWRLEAAVYKALETAERAHRAALEARVSGETDLPSCRPSDAFNKQQEVEICPYLVVHPS